jgi:prepilin-type N-terminal cleavage/methylation domain-containing protein
MERLRNLRNDRGFTLIELIAASAVTSGVAWVVQAVT